MLQARVSASYLHILARISRKVNFRCITATSKQGMNYHTWSEKDEKCAKAIPKVELHLHLDGSLSPEFIAQRARARGMKLPVPTIQLQSWLMAQKRLLLAKDFEQKKGKNWPVFDFCNQFLQTSQELTTATKDLLSRLASENVRYAEIRFCPELHTLESLTCDQAVEAVLHGYRSQETVLGGVVVCALRSKTEEHGIKMAKLAGKYLQRSAVDPVGVVGFDIAGDEGSYPLSSPKHSMVAACEEANEFGVPITIHAGEYVTRDKCEIADNVRFAIKLGAKRIGHGIVLKYDEELINEVKKANVTVEVCLTSNIANGYKVKSIAEHPVKEMWKSGVQFTLSSDNLLLSGDEQHLVSPTGEVVQLVRDLGLGWEAVKTSVLCGAAAAFSPAVDEAWVDRLRRDIDAVLSSVLQR